MDASTYSRLSIWKAWVEAHCRVCWVSFQYRGVVTVSMYDFSPCGMNWLLLTGKCRRKSITRLCFWLQHLLEWALFLVFMWKFPYTCRLSQRYIQWVDANSSPQSLAHLVYYITVPICGCVSSAFLTCFLHIVTLSFLIKFSFISVCVCLYLQAGAHEEVRE